MFKRVYVEITNSCNLSCSFCPSSRRKLEFMPLDRFELILSQLQGITKHLYFHVKGEPLLHTRLIDYIELSSRKGFLVNLTTNGTLIGNWQEELLQVTGLRQISFSLQSFEGEAVPELEAYINPIIAFAKEAIIRDIFVELRLWNLEKIHIGVTRNKRILEFIEDGFELTETIKEEVLNVKGTKLKKGLYLSQSYEFQWPSMEQEILHIKGSCYGLRQQLAILVDGTVVPCCLDQEGDINLGNITKTSLIEILDSIRVKDIMQGFENKKLVEELCMRCGYRERFK